MKSLPFIVLAGIGIFLFFFFTRKASADTGGYSAMPNDVPGSTANSFGGTLTSMVQKGLAGLSGSVALPGVGSVSAFPVFAAVGVGSEVIEKKTGVTAATAINPGYEIPKQTIIAGVQSVFQTANDIKKNPLTTAAIPTIYAPTKAASNFLVNLSGNVLGKTGQNIAKKAENFVSKITFGLF